MFFPDSPPVEEDHIEAKTRPLPLPLPFDDLISAVAGKEVFGMDDTLSDFADSKRKKPGTAVDKGVFVML